MELKYNSMTFIRSKTFKKFSIYYSLEYSLPSSVVIGISFDRWNTALREIYIKQRGITIVKLKL